MKKIITATVILINCNSVFAQVYNCNGIYKNSPCDTATETKAVTAPSKPVDPMKQALSRKKSITHDLAMRVININREYKLAYNTEAIEDYCQDESTTVADCADKAEELNEKIDKRIESIETIRAQKKANELQELRLKEELDKPDVTIIQQVYIEPTPTFDPYNPGRWPNKPPHWHDDRPRPVKPAPKPVDPLHEYGKVRKR